MSPITKRLTFRLLTKTRAAVAISTALILFGVLDARGPHGATLGSPPDTNAMASNRATVPPEQSPHRAATRQGPSRQIADQGVAIQRVAARFVTACDTTNPAQPQGDQAIEAALAPGLVLHKLVQPAAMSTEDRATTVKLDAPGRPVPGRGGTVAVIVTGTMSVTSDGSPLQRVPIVERITLRPRASVPTIGGHPETASDASGWQVVGVEAGA